MQIRLLLWALTYRAYSRWRKTRASTKYTTLSTGEDPIKAEGCKAQVGWVGLDHGEPMEEPVEVLFKDVPKFLVRKLKQMRLPKLAKNVFRQRYGMKI